MFTDMVGYTALSQSNEPLALRLLGKHRELVRPALAKHRGREIKTIGDAFLVEFDSALDAVNCAVEVQEAIRSYNAGTIDKVAIRVGIHVGDVVHQQGDVYGDAVNIASRIEPLAVGGGICISEQTYDQVRNKVPFRLVKMDSRELKNVSIPIDVYKVELPWEGATRKMETGPLPADRIAVLPFVNISPDPADEYFADGMTEELITSLSLVKGLKVIARTSVMNYKRKEKNISEIGRELGVGTIVEGSIRKAMDRIRVTVQVIDVNSEEHLWASNYDAKLDDVFSVQSDIAGKVAGSLPGALPTMVKAASVVTKDTEDVNAYMNYLQGRELMYDKLEAPLRQSLQFFEHAVERDPKFARAYAGMAQTYASLGLAGFMPWRDSIDTARAFVDKALVVNPNLSEAHSIRSLLAYMADEPFEVMSGEAQKAIELNPNEAQAYLQLGQVMPLLGKLQEWVRLLEMAYQLDPLSPRIIELLSGAYLYSGRDADLLGLLRRTVHLQPLNSHRWMWTFYVIKGNLEEAAKEVAELESLEPTWEFTMMSKGYLAGMKGDRKTAEEVIASLEQTHMLGWARSSIAGLIYFAMGDMDIFFDKMRLAAEEHTLRATDLMYSPLFAKARSDPRLPAILALGGIKYPPSQ
ncbi:MAG TPA: adenylate/guanylate cyclase domain-containing protein [Nitrososphaerales archaeon]|nr:adenylate/guanylate cyclase domain-containing protein [Nitrososphaerales archaeon]